jgi:hypothetical protein
VPLLLLPLVLIALVVQAAEVAGSSPVNFGCSPPREIKPRSGFPPLTD